jgi:serine/threonine protein phosphatase PrpC
MELYPTPTAADLSRPRPEQIDIFGLTHPGRVRPENQDQFLIASLHKTMMVHFSSIAHEHLGRLTSDSRGFVFLVADGVGGGPSGQLASGTALQAIVDYVIHAMDLYLDIDESTEPQFLAQLRRSVERSHEKIMAEGESGETGGMATTLTMVTVRWPKAYLVHVGDSRCYRLRNGRLEMMTKDQTMAQALLDAGALNPDTAEHSGLKHVLWSALGGREASPETLTVDINFDDIMLICSDGLNKHVSDDEIQEHLLRTTSSEATVRELIDLALERGGSDNVTVVMSRLRRDP